MNGKISNDFNFSSVRPEVLEGSTEGFSAESITGSSRRFVLWYLVRSRLELSLS
jgi:hypothetical protein